ncbi:MAG: hypothetical protein KDA65_17775 [Planctomycetaceae bacterium]|nr:hypothetical protein [Planctomycetaceae bacterium]
MSGINTKQNIRRLIDAEKDPTSPNQLTVDNVKDWLADYIEMRAEEIAHFPQEANKNHWDLIAADYDSTKEALFIAAYFCSDEVTFLAGRGPVLDVRAFAQSNFPVNPDEVLDHLAQRFIIGERWTTHSDDITAWLQG